VLAVVGTTIFVGAGTLAQTDEASPADAAERLGVDREVEMGVVAGQWFWRFDVDGVPPTQGERVVLPADTIIQFKTTSADVIHSFAIKELGNHQGCDARPGEPGVVLRRRIEGERRSCRSQHRMDKPRLSLPTRTRFGARNSVAKATQR